MALNFPNSPTIGDEFTGGGFVWTWTGSAWEKVVSDTGSAAQLGFDLVIGTSGNTTFELASLQSAGEYTISSALNDSTYDVYFINESDQNVGYSTTGKITATEAFKKIVVYGGTNNDILNFSFGFVSEPTGNGNVNGGAAPFITSISPNNLPNDNDTMLITGGNFAADVQVILIGTSNTQYAPKTTVRSSSTQITVTRPDGLLASDGPYDVRVINPGITPAAQKSNQLTNTMFVGSGVTWSTGTTLPPFTPGSAYSTTVVASDPDASTITYSLISGSLPTGMSLSSAGAISGTSNDTSTATPTIRATDAGGNIADRQFSLSATVAATGGTTVTSGGYRYHTFTSSGTFTVTRGGAVEIVTVAGGGQGRVTSDSYKAGGGAGGFLISNTTLSAQSYSLVVGGAGSNTTFGSLTALTAIAGGPGVDTTGGGASGGSGGGNTYGPGGGGTANQGNGGGTGRTLWDQGRYGGGAGGGRSGGGSDSYVDGNNATRGGVGGGGIQYTTWGAATSTGELSGGQRYYAGGGGGQPGAINGIGHGANTGGGGAGGSAGDSGLIMIRYAI